MPRDHADCVRDCLQGGSSGVQVTLALALARTRTRSLSPTLTLTLTLALAPTLNPHGVQISQAEMQQFQAPLNELSLLEMAIRNATLTP